MAISSGGWKEVYGDIKAPVRPLSQKTLTEMWAGRKLSEQARMEKSLSPADYVKYIEWNAGAVVPEGARLAFKR